MSNYSRSRTRKFLYQLLYASTYDLVNIEEFKDSFFSGVFDSNLDEEYLKEMYDLIIDNQQFLLNLVQKYAPKFKVYDMDLSYVLPIFIGATEILYYKQEIPLKVSINEAVELAKVYGDDSSKKMVNGVMYNFSKELDVIVGESKNYILEEDVKDFFKK